MIDSTNSEALRRARGGETGPLWVVAERQEAGRGRRGRVWDSPSGNLYATCLLTEVLAPERAALLGLVAALALADAVEDVAEESRGRLAVKWPNDILADGAKLAGILIETESVPGQDTRLVVGIGANCVSHPDNLPYQATSLCQLGAGARSADLFHALSARWTDWLDVWRSSSGFSTIRDRWLDRAIGLGGPITVRLPEATLSGTFEDLDRQGRLILRNADGTRRLIGYGEVFLGPAAGIGI